jgi:hypothetical protein
VPLAPDSDSELESESEGPPDSAPVGPAATDRHWPRRRPGGFDLGVGIAALPGSACQHCNLIMIPAVVSPIGDQDRASCSDEFRRRNWYRLNSIARRLRRQRTHCGAR